MSEKSGFDLGKQRLVLLSSLSVVCVAILYLYMFDIILLLVMGLAVWYIYDYVQDYTRQLVDPAGKYVFITGCDSGFGLESAKALQEAGFGVIAGCFDDQSSGAKELKNRPWVQKVEVLILDVSNESSVLACAREVKDIVRDQGLWAVINNAGINSWGPVELVSMEMYHRCAQVNLFGPIRVIKSVLPLVRQAQGRIINITSERAFNPWKDNSAYCVAKFGLEAFSACLRQEMSEFKVKVITIAPGQFAGATSIVKQNLNQQIVDKLLNAHANLSLQDQENSYKKESIAGLNDRILADIQKSCTSCEPVVRAYVDAVLNINPRQCYLIHGFRRQCLDPLIIMARIRPFVPVRLVPYVEKALMAVLG